MRAKAPALLRVIASPITDSPAVAKFVVAPYHRVPEREETHRWIKSGILIRKQPLIDILSKPNREYWNEGSNFWVALYADDHNLSGIGIDEIKLHLPRNPQGSSTLTIDHSALNIWFFDRVLHQLL